MLPSDFQLKRLYGQGVDWPLTYEQLEKWYCEAETELGVAGDHDVWNGFLGARRSRPFPMSAIWPSDSDKRMAAVAEGADLDGHQLRVRPIPQARNSEPYQDRPTCAGNSTCIPLCPIGAKYDATVHLKRARQRGAQICDLVQAVKLDIENGRVVGVVARDGRTNETRTYRGATVVACAHAIETVRLLWASGYDDPSKQLGQNLMDHPTSQMVGLAPWKAGAFRGPPATSGIDDLRDGGFRRTSAAWKASLGNDGWGRFQSPDSVVGAWMRDGLVGAKLREKIADDAQRLFRISWAAEQLPSPDNRIEQTGVRDKVGLPGFRLRYSVDNYTLGAFAVARGAIRRLLERAGMSMIQVDPDPTTYGGSGHIMGTFRMGASPADGVVDANCRSFTVSNLFLVGSGAFPTVGTANPTLTVAALALRTAALIGGSNHS